MSQQQAANTPRSQLNSQVKAQVLPLLEEVIQDEFAHKVWVESVVDDFGPAKLREKGPEVTGGKQKPALSAARY